MVRQAKHTITSGSTSKMHSKPNNSAIPDTLESPSQRGSGTSKHNTVCNQHSQPTSRTISRTNPLAPLRHPGRPSRIANKSIPPNGTLIETPHIPKWPTYKLQKTIRNTLRFSTRVQVQYPTNYFRCLYYAERDSNHSHQTSNQYAAP